VNGTIDFSYEFKRWPEFAWAALVAAVIALGQIVITTDPSKVEDWKLWAITAAGALARAVGGALLAKLTRGTGQNPTTP